MSISADCSSYPLVAGLSHLIFLAYVVHFSLTLYGSESHRKSGTSGWFSSAPFYLLWPPSLLFGQPLSNRQNGCAEGGGEDSHMGLSTKGTISAELATLLKSWVSEPSLVGEICVRKTVWVAWAESTVPRREQKTARSAVHMDAHRPWCPPALGCSYFSLVSLSSRLLLRSSKEGKPSVPHLHAFSLEQLWVPAHPGQRPFLRRAAGPSALSQGCRMATLTKSPFAHWLDTCFLNEFLGSFVMVIFPGICIPNRRVAFLPKKPQLVCADRFLPHSHRQHKGVATGPCCTVTQFSWGTLSVEW